MTAIDPSVSSLEAKLTEACDALWDNFVDPREPYAGEEGGWWAPVGGLRTSGAQATAPGPMSETQLAELRAECRQLAITNEFAINGHENRISYIVGQGHSYQVNVRKGVDDSIDLAMQAQIILDQFRHKNRWHQRQQEMVRRLDRDGEVFLRVFSLPGGETRVRFVEPDQVSAPAPRNGDTTASFGVHTDSDDVESVIGYYIDGRLVDASEIQHRKANVDSNVKRGLPLFTPVRKNLRRADKLLRNMSVVSEIQSAIALIRKHRSASRNGVEQFVADTADKVGVDASGRSQSSRYYGAGTILDAPEGLEYQFPTTGVDASSYVAILQAELRAIAARLVMPEYMLSSNASNSNYASTIVAEGPAMRMFERLQASLVEDDCDLMWRVLENAVRAGRLPSDMRQRVELQITPPTLRIRDPLQEARVDRIAYDNGVLSKQTWSQRLGLDYEQEQRNRMNDEKQ
ncbi:MAG: phage portal protein [Planctomycetota bacterium]